MKLTTVTCYFLFALFHMSQVDSGRVSIAQNGYSYIQVGISPDVPYDPQIISNLQTIITKASSVLYRATNNRAYFKDVRILIPEIWNIQSEASTWELYDQADVKVAPRSLSNGDTPYTVQSGGCGAPGEYIHYTPEYLKTSAQPDNIAKYGIPENIFVHEWAHLRYGVFDEYGYPGDEKYPVFQTAFYDPIPNICTNDYPPRFDSKDQTTLGPCNNDPTTGLPDGNCIFELHPDYLPSSSLMSMFNKDSVFEFCDDKTHNQFNPNKQNDMCSGESIWSIISRHPDFANNNNPPSNINNWTPSFSIVKSRSSRFVLVMDVSGSMRTYSRITRMYEAAFRWILYDIPLHSSLGLVQFSTSAQVLSYLTKIETDSDRYKLVDVLPDRAIGNTCIGCGLLEAINLLKSSGEGGNIILMTDGEENEKPYVADVMPQILQARVQVSSIAFGREAENLIENIAMQTGGQSYFVDDTDYVAGLSDALIGCSTGSSQAVPSTDAQVKLFQQQYKTGINTKQTRKTIMDEFIIDTTIGRNLVFRIDYQTKSTLQRIEIQSPSGVIYNNNFIYDDTAKCIFFKQDLAEDGKWTFTLTVTTSTVDSFVVRVTSQTRISTDQQSSPITVQCYFPDGAVVADARTTPVRILAKVMQGTTPIKSARVKATVFLPNKSTLELELLDNGAFADTAKDDGIYSRYFTGATEADRYSVTCEAWDDGNAYYVDNSNKSLTGNFLRTESGGSVRIETPAATIDPYPPGRVQDLVVYDVKCDSKLFPVKFTAPGEELDQGGRVTRYEIKISKNFDDLTEANFGKPNPNVILVTDEAVNGTIAPSVDPAMTQYFTFLINEMEWNVTYFIAMRSFDASGSVSRVSNPANFRFRPPICPHGEYWAPCTCSCESTEGLVTSIYGDFAACPCEAYFYQLAHDDIYTDFCYPGLFFNPDIFECDFPSNNPGCVDK